MRTSYCFAGIVLRRHDVRRNNTLTAAAAAAAAAASRILSSLPSCQFAAAGLAPRHGAG